MSYSYKADLAILTLTVLVAIGWVTSQLGTGLMPPLLFTGIRFSVSALLLTLFCYKQLVQLKQESLWLAVKTGLVLVMASIVWIYAVSLSEQIGEGAFITSTKTLLVPFIGYFLFKISIPGQVFFALPVAVTGLGLLVLDGNWQFEPAQVLFLLAACLYALHAILLNRFGQGIPAMALTTIQMYLVGVVSLAGSLLFEPISISMTSDAGVILCISIFVATCLRFCCQTWGFKHSEPNRTAIIMILEPVWTSLLGVWMFNEVFEMQGLLGCVLIVLALVITRWSPFRKRVVTGFE
ncbi:hypothetical protein GZ77_00245 [Endozoicomonas montiporae]|uniref:EamA domain-containing protein n=2 Tax=Endozoicomonas montiporae TaxID=1027273 RepID=A0A081N9P6_9GAMM|nr:DMT family transporter [Endozoicomonas montiporae]AMO55023.1 permease of the drug/metabolite transporter (DMT) superfamily protein [Endozoicomonas montiporae CL-33]KEQ15169.1 hypothetical protein GZ77_00245 [Endozoicomonas montiporae]